MKSSVKMSPNTETTPELNSSFSVSTSLVMRVIRRPTGFLSKKRRSRRWKWAKISVRRSYITLWPSQVVSMLLPVLEDGPSVTAAM